LESSQFFTLNIDLFNEFCDGSRSYSSKSNFMRGAESYIRRNIETNEFKKFCPNVHLTNEELITKLEDSKDKYNNLKNEHNKLNKNYELLKEERDDYKKQLDYINKDELIKNVIEGSKVMKDKFGLIWENSFLRLFTI